MLMRTARKGFPSSHTIFQALPMSALSPISLQLCCLLCFFGGERGFKAACHKSPDILVVTGWSPVRRGFPLSLWVGVIVLWLLVSLWSTWERSILSWSPAVWQEQQQRREVLCGDALLCQGSCVGEFQLSALLVLSLDITTGEKKKKKWKDSPLSSGKGMKWDKGNVNARQIPCLKTQLPQNLWDNGMI